MNKGPRRSEFPLDAWIFTEKCGTYMKWPFMDLLVHCKFMSTMIIAPPVITHKYKQRVLPKGLESLDKLLNIVIRVRDTVQVSVDRFNFGKGLHGPALWGLEWIVSR